MTGLTRDLTERRYSEIKKLAPLYFYDPGVPAPMANGFPVSSLTRGALLFLFLIAFHIMRLFSFPFLIAFLESDGPPTTDSLTRTETASASMASSRSSRGSSN